MNFMTTQGSHNDTFAATAHRKFFENYSKGQPEEECGYDNAHISDCTDALAVAVPVYLYHRNKLQGQALVNETIEGIKVIRPITSFAEAYVRIFVEMMNDAFEGRTVAEICKSAASKIPNFGNLDEIIKTPVPVAPCGIEHGFPVMLNIMYRNSTNLLDALLQNANAGGDNTSRGFLIGAVMGAALGSDKAFLGMHDRKTL